MSNTPSPTTSSYRFVGAYTCVLDLVEMKEFGQKVDFTDEQAETILRGGGLILPASTMASFFTDAEMKEKSFPKFPGHWFSAPDDLKAKKKAAVAAAVALHEAAVARWNAGEKAKVDAKAAKAKADADLAAAQAEEADAAKAAAASSINASEQAITNEKEVA